ncbi:TPA: hypothetical protein MDG15_000102 [Citrobacter freundii]|nr:hypothetical protein [Citrobacter freundii]HBN5497889.1 hypothetical protein [Citrobacter freundii]HBU9121890.1 hypothetical protein [Citrobacter freundii]
MGSFFTVVDEPKSQRVILYRANEAIDNAIYLDTDPTGTAIPFPDVLDKVDMGSATNKAGFILPYKTGVKLAITTNLPATGVSGDDLTLVWVGGVAPYRVKVEVIDKDLLLDDVLQPEKTYTYDTQGHPTGQYVIIVEDAHGNKVTSATCTIS